MHITEGLCVRIITSFILMYLTVFCSFREKVTSGKIKSLHCAISFIHDPQ